METNKLSRKTFLASTAAGLLALTRRARAGGTPPPAAPAAKPIAPPAPAAVHPPVLKPSEWDGKKLAETLKTRKPHKLVFQSVEARLILPGLASLYSHIQNALNGAEISHGYGHGSVAVAAALSGPSIAFSLDDAMWAKYKLGELFDFKDAAGKPETSNVYYKAQTNLSTDTEPGLPGNVYQDWSGEACLKRGVRFMVCHNALSGLAARIGMKTGEDPRTVVAELKANLLPGYMIVPSAMAALLAAQEAGWKLIPLL